MVLRHDEYFDSILDWRRVAAVDGGGYEHSLSTTYDAVCADSDRRPEPEAIFAECVFRC